MIFKYRVMSLCLRYIKKKAYIKFYIVNNFIGYFPFANLNPFNRYFPIKKILFYKKMKEGGDETTVGLKQVKGS